MEEGGSDAQSRLVFMHFSKLLRAFEPQSDLWKEAWNRINTVFESTQFLEYRHFLFCYILASGELQSSDSKSSKSLRFDEGHNDTENDTKMPKLSGFHDEVTILLLLQKCITRALNENPIKEGSYVFIIEVLNHFPTLKIDENSDLEPLLLRLLDKKFLSNVKVSKKLHVELCMTLLKQPNCVPQDNFLQKIFSIVLEELSEDWASTFTNGFLEFGFYTLISQGAFLDKLQKALKSGAVEGQNLLKIALQFGK